MEKSILISPSEFRDGSDASQGVRTVVLSVVEKWICTACHSAYYPSYIDGRLKMLGA